MHLLPCPFCGSDPAVKYIGNEHSNKLSIKIRCPICRIQRTDSSILHGFEWLESVAESNWNERYSYVGPTQLPKGGK